MNPNEIFLALSCFWSGFWVFVVAVVSLFFVFLNHSNRKKTTGFRDTSVRGYHYILLQAGETSAFLLRSPLGALPRSSLGHLA